MDPVNAGVDPPGHDRRPDDRDSRPDDPERIARAGLCRIATLPGAPADAEIRAAGAVVVWERVRGRYPTVEPLRDLEAADRVGAVLICPGDPDWPVDLSLLDRGGGRPGDPGSPIALWARGGGLDAELFRRAVAVVGARAATAYGMHVASEIGFGLAERGWTVVSGAAFGIDAAAHRGALAVAGPTVAVLAGGVDVPYPAAHAGLLEEVASEGLVLSEAPPGSPPLRRRFLTRNRLIAALAAGTVLVEAGLRSGALSTARHARTVGRPVMAVPGPVTSALSVGCHRLLREHREETVVVTGVADICEEIGRIGDLADRGGAPPSPRDGLSEIVQALLDAMPARSAVGVSVLARRIGRRPEEVLGMLGPLAVEGLVEAVPDGYRLTSLGRAPTGSGLPSDRFLR